MFNAINGSSTIGRTSVKQCVTMRHAMLHNSNTNAQALLIEHIANLMVNGPRYKLREAVIYANPSDLVMQRATAKAMRQHTKQHGPKQMQVLLPSILSNDASIRHYPMGGETGLPTREKRESKPIRPVLSKKAKAMQKVLERMDLDLY